MAYVEDLQELLKHELNDLYSAEVQLIDALPLLVKKSSDKELKKAFSDHLKETKNHRKRLLQIQDILEMDKATDDNGFFFNLFQSKEGEAHCLAMEGLVKEADHLMKQGMAPGAMDAALIAAAQKVEHYEISSYGSAKAFAKQLGLTEVADLLSATLKEEYVADTLLTGLAMSKINEEAEGIKFPALQKKPVIQGKPGKKSTGTRSNKKSAAKLPAREKKDKPDKMKSFTTE